MVSLPSGRWTDGKHRRICVLDDGHTIINYKPPYTDSRGLKLLTTLYSIAVGDFLNTAHGHAPSGNFLSTFRRRESVRSLIVMIDVTLELILSLSRRWHRIMELVTVGQV